jgi:putative transposase
MPRARRTSLAAPFFHVVNRSVRKMPIFVRPPDYRAFLKVLEEGLARYPVRLMSFCVLSNHWHLVLGPSGTADLIRFMQWVTATHAIRWQRLRHLTGQGPLYQGRYHSSPLTGAADLIRACRYVERNALRARLVQRAQDWPWCSLAERLQPASSVPLVPAPFLMSDAWIHHVNATATLREQLAEAGVGRLRARDPADDPGRLPGGTERAERRVRRVARTHEHEADPAVERPEHLRVVDAARALQPPKQRRHRPALEVK